MVLSTMASHVPEGPHPTGYDRNHARGTRTTQRVTKLMSMETNVSPAPRSTPVTINMRASGT